MTMCSNRTNLSSLHICYKFNVYIKAKLFLDSYSHFEACLRIQILHKYNVNFGNYILACKI